MDGQIKRFATFNSFFQASNLVYSIRQEGRLYYVRIPTSMRSGAPKCPIGFVVSYCSLPHPYAGEAVPAINIPQVKVLQATGLA